MFVLDMMLHAGAPVTIMRHDRALLSSELLVQVVDLYQRSLPPFETMALLDECIALRSISIVSGSG
jgi:hypothetical protein